MRNSGITTLIFVAMTLLSGCGTNPPVAVEVKDACTKAVGTNVVLKGFFSLPKQLEVTKYTRGGQGAGINYKLILMTKKDATGDAVFVNMSGTVDPRPNKIKMLPDNYTWNDLVVYTEDGKTLAAGEAVQLTGTIAPDDKDKCRIDVSKIERL